MPTPKSHHHNLNRQFLFLAAPAIYVLAADVFNGESALAGSLLKILFLSILVVLSVFGWGSLVLGIFQTDEKPGEAERALLAFVFGCALLYLAYLILLITGFFRPIPLIVMLIAGMVPAIRGLRTLLSVRAEAQNWTKIQTWLLSAVLLVAGIRIVCGLTPLINYDAYVYQFFTPAQYLQQGRFFFIPWNVYTNSPMSLQTVLGSSLALDSSGQTFKLIITVTTLFLPAAAALLTHRAGRTASLMAAFFALCYPAFWVGDTLGTIDYAVAGFVLLGAAWFREAIRPGDRKIYQLASGIAFGLALSSRYQVVFIIGIALLLFSVEAFIQQKKEASRKIVLSTVTICGLIFAITAPWLLKSWVYTKNPVYPLFYETLDGAEWSLDQQNRLNFDVFGAPLKAFPLREQMIAPVRSLFVQPYNAFLGIIILACSIAAILFSPEFRFIALVGLISVIFWGLIHPVADVRLFRFNAAGFVFLMAACAAFAERYRKFSVAVGFLIAAASLVVSMISLRHAFSIYLTVTKNEYRTNFQRANIPGWNAFDAANRMLDPKKDRVLLIGETRGFALKIPVISPSGFNSPQLLTLFAPANQPESWNNNFKKMGITHIVVSLLEWRHLQEKQYYGYLNIPFEPQRQILTWLQQQKVLYEDRSGNALLQVR